MPIYIVYIPDRIFFKNATVNTLIADLGSVSFPKWQNHEGDEV